ncbi:MAG: isoprenoid biosynthesis glyoxalase ElbB [Pseudomonadota bacterium]
MATKKRIAVILAGCGYVNGSETTESVASLISIGQLGAEAQCFSINKNFESPEGSRSLITESGLLCRDQVIDLAELKEEAFDGLLIPGGFGVAKHLCHWYDEGAQCFVEPQISKTIQGFYDASKPIGALCIAPALVAKVLGQNEITVTIGNDKETATELEKTGAIHEDCDVDDFVTDRAHKVISSPAYMYDNASPHQVFKGIHGLVSELVEMA